MLYYSISPAFDVVSATELHPRPPSHTLPFCLPNFATRWIWMPLLMKLVFWFCLVFLSTLWQCDFRYISLFFVPPHCHLLSLPASLTFSFLDRRSCCFFPSLSSPNSHTHTHTHRCNEHMRSCALHTLWSRTPRMHTCTHAQLISWHSVDARCKTRDNGSIS